MKRRAVMTGVGILAGNGKGKDEFWQSLKEGRIGYRPATVFDPAEYSVKQVGEVPDFDAKVYMGPKGLRLLDRATRLMISAGRLCVLDSGFKVTPENTDDVGVSVGTTLGSIKSIYDFDYVTLTEGPRYVNPALFPNTVINSPASQVSIWEHIEGFNTTISTGFTASLDAMTYAHDFIVEGKYKLIYTGGVEEMCWQTFMGFYVLQFLSGSKPGEEFINCPFDRRRNGVTFGEGACLVAMEEYEHAQERGAKILAEVGGFGYSFDPFRIHKYNPRGVGLKRSMRSALEDAAVSPEDIDCIFANANSTVAADRIETEAIKEIFGKRAYEIPVTAVKSMVGECYSVSGAIAVAAAIGAITQDFIPPTINYQEKDADCDLDYVPNQSRPARLNNILIINFAPSGSNTCMVLKRFQE